MRVTGETVESHDITTTQFLLFSIEYYESKQ